MRKINYLLLALFATSNLFAVDPLTGGGVLAGGDMETSSVWSISNLKSNNPKPTLIWNEAALTPQYGQGGCLRITSAGATGDGSVVGIYQTVQLTAGKIYTFNGAFCDNAGGLEKAGAQVYISKTMPVDGTDYTEGMISEFNSWGTNVPKDKDETFALGAAGSRKFVCGTSGEYYFVVKIGVWEGKAMDVSIDELSLTETDIVPISAGGVIIGGNMEDGSKWTVSNINATAPAAVTTWNYTGDCPVFGKNGCVRINGKSKGNTFQWFAYQKVVLEQGKTYKFDAAFKDLTTGIYQAWIEIYLRSVEYPAGEDVSNTNGMIQWIGVWGGGAPINNTFGNVGGISGEYTCAASGDYYLGIKMGNMDWNNADNPFDVLLDEVSFTDKATTAMPQVNAHNYKIYSVNKTITVEGVHKRVEIINLSGICVEKKYTNGAFYSSKHRQGVYIVKVDGVSHKVVVN